MKLNLELTNDTPIYGQIAENIKKQILEGDLVGGDSLPSMRKLAEQLGVSLITTKRAYQELEQKRWIVTMVGRGTFVCNLGLERVMDAQRLEVEKHLRKGIVSALGSKVSLEEMTELLELLYHEEQEEQEHRKRASE